MASGPAAPAGTDARRPWEPALVIAGVLGALAAWSWRRWPDPLIDFGRELYVAWQLSEGRLLYRDVASLFGPLSPYLNAAWFRLFGPSLLTLAICNLALVALLAWAIYGVLRPATDRRIATVATLAFLLLFAFPQYVIVGNYNYVTPYSHEMTHGVLLATLMILALGRGFTGGGQLATAAAGLCLGLAALTKIELAAAAAAAAATGVAGFAAIAREPLGRLAARVLVFLAAAVLPPLGFFVFFAQHVGPAQAAAFMAAPLAAVITSGIGSTPYYRAGAGLDDPAANALRMAAALGLIVTFVAALAGIALMTARLHGSRATAVLRIASRALVVIVLGLFAPWTLLPRALPLTTLLMLAAVAAIVYRLRADRGAALRQLPFLCWCVFALALLPKMLLHARLSHYGFVLAMPATLVLIVGLLWVAPLAVDRAGGAGRQFRGLALVAIAVGITVHLATSHALLRAKSLDVGRPPDSFLAFDSPARWQGRAVRDVQALIARTLAPDETLAVVPEGAMVNFLTRRRNPTPYHTLMPPELRIYGEDRILAAWRAAPPDYVLVVSKTMQDYGVGPFGSASYGPALGAFIGGAYSPVAVVGTDEEGRPAMELRKRLHIPPARVDRARGSTVLSPYGRSTCMGGRHSAERSAARPCAGPRSSPGVS